MRYRNLCYPLLSILLLTSCDNVFQTHPYDVYIKGEHDLNTKSIAKIEAAFADKDTLRIAFISDTHLRTGTSISSCIVAT